MNCSSWLKLLKLCKHATNCFRWMSFTENILLLSLLLIYTKALSESICQFAGLTYKNDKTLVLVALPNNVTQHGMSQTWIIKSPKLNSWNLKGPKRPHGPVLTAYRSRSWDPVGRSLACGHIAILWSVFVHYSSVYNILKVLLDPLKNKPFSQNWHNHDFFRCSKAKIIKINQVIF